MNVERLHSIALAMKKELDDTRELETVQALRDALTNQVTTPQEASFQQQVRDARDKLRTDLANVASDSFPPSWRQVVDDLDANDYLGAALLTWIDEIFGRNQITPSVARDEITELASGVEHLSQGLTSLLAGLDFFDIGTETLLPGEAEVSVLIPRPAVDDELSQLGAEFRDLERILGPFLELSEGSRPPLKVKTISSSDFAIYLGMVPGAAAVLANALDRILNSYKSILEIRKLRQELSNQGMPDDSLAGVDDFASSQMGAEIHAASQEIVNATSGVDPGRANELVTELQRSMNALAMRIDVGFNIDVRATPPVVDEVDGEDPEAVTETAEAALVRQQLLEIAGISPRLKFINNTGRPILRLEDGRHTTRNHPDVDSDDELDT